jgi:hypothetical protein
MEVADEEGRETMTMMLTLGGGVRLSLVNRQHRDRSVAGSVGT